METKKFSQEELTEIQNLRNQSSEIITQLGQIEAETFLADQRLEQLAQSKEMLRTRFNQMQEKESQLIQSLTEKYGDGTVDVASGEFKPTN